jgi:hypothetical protein
MKKHVLVLLALLALIPFAQLMAQAPPVAPSPAKGAEAPSPDVAQTPDLAPLLVSPAGEQTETPSDLVPESSYLLCTSTEECPTGELCCNVCGALPFGDPSSCMRCVEPVRKRCPLVV